ncbi:MAG: hypothetical protein K2O29_01075 [Ruminococcus sp.]|nr:hypothetical protein [Ruminococcus sp.]
MINSSKMFMSCILSASQPSKTVVLITVILLFTLTFIISAVVTYRIRKKKLSEKSRQNLKDKNSEQLSGR